MAFQGRRLGLQQAMAKICVNFLRAVGLGVAAALAALVQPALAGPPFVSDDPQPTDLGHWGIYNFVAATQTPGDLAGQGGLDINYGGAKDLQLTAVLPVDFEGGKAPGLGDIQLGAKYRFLHQAEGALSPDVAVFPRLIVPTAGRAFGGQRLNLLLPVWAQKDFGPWSLFGGGGYQLNPGAGERNFWQSGLAVTRALGERLTLGAEVYHQTPDDAEAKPYTGVNLGVIYKASAHWSLLAAAGPGVENARQGGQYAAYLALEATY
jgi:hypothetical protein